VQAGASHRRASRALRIGLLVAAVAAIAVALLADLLLGGEPGLGIQQGLLIAVGLGLGVLALLPMRIVLNVLLAAAAVCVGVLLIEVGLRLFRADYFASIYRLEPHHLHELVPGARRIFTREPVNGGGEHPVQVNSRGFRGDELLAPGAARRIVVYGDSFIAGEFSDLDATFARRLGAKLSDALGTPVEAVNAGVVGYSPDQESLRMEQELGWLQPELVVVAVFADNDFGDLLRKKLFRLDGAGALEPNPFTIAPSLRAQFWRAEHSPLTVRLATRILAAVSVPKLEPHAAIEDALARSRREYQETVVEGNREVWELLAGHYDADVSLEPESESARYKVALMDAVLQRIQRIARENGVPLVLLIIPSPVDAIEDYELGTVDVNAHPAYRPETLTDRVEAIAVRHQIPSVNLFAPFRERGASALYFRGNDNHWNDAGQDFAAALTANFVLSQGLLAPK
jgi:hypothetical protein